MSFGRGLLAALLALGLRAAAGRLPGLELIFDPLLVVAILTAVSGRIPQVIGMALITGGLEDAWTGTWYGEHSFTHLLSAYLICLVAQQFDMTGVWTSMAATFAGTLADWGLQVGLFALFDRSVATIPAVPIWLLAGGANAATAAALHRLLLRRREKRGRR